MEGHVKKCVERYCELANKTTQQLYTVSTPCIDDHLFKEEELKSVGELSKVCSQIVLKCLYANTHAYFCLEPTFISHTHEGDGVSQSRLPLLLPKCPEKPDSYVRVIAMAMGLSRTWLAQAATSFPHGPSPQAAVRTRCTPRLNIQVRLTARTLLRLAHGKE